MDDLTPPALPSPEAEGLTESDGLLAPVTDPGYEPPGEERRPGEEAIDLVTWAHRVTNAGVDGTRRTVCRLGVPGLDRVESAGGRAAADNLLEHVRRSVARAHEPDLGVVATGRRELVFLLPDGLPWSAAAETVRAALEEFAEGCAPEPCGVSAGLAETTTDGDAIECALRRTSIGLAAAVEGGGGARMVDGDTERRLARDGEVERGLREALASGAGLRLVYQPRYAVEGVALVGAEALLRHESSTLGAVGPDEFIPIAREAGLLGEIDRWVLERALGEIARWGREDVLGVPISINVGAATFLDDGFVPLVESLLDETRVAPESLQLEVGTPRVLGSLERAAAQVRALRTLGVGIALDDFGRDDVTAADLRQLPVDVVKVHRSLVAELGTSDSATVLVQSVLSLAKVLGIETVANGVETEDQLARLRELGCDAVQGYVRCAPLERAAFTERLRGGGGQRSFA